MRSTVPQELPKVKSGIIAVTMTRNGAKRALSELEAFARNEEDGCHSTPVEGGWLEAEALLDGDMRHRYNNRVITREKALSILETR